mmetsp:Transcript_26709/g.66076  ORF Transcript_26709/g.66076 Transcript_26709/m.66076 type:complete len:216 (-) Transcript_26709:227-874(-)
MEDMFCLFGFGCFPVMTSARSSTSRSTASLHRPRLSSRHLSSCPSPGWVAWAPPQRPAARLAQAVPHLWREMMTKQRRHQQREPPQAWRRRARQRSRWTVPLRDKARAEGLLRHMRYWTQAARRAATKSAPRWLPLSGKSASRPRSLNHAQKDAPPRPYPPPRQGGLPPAPWPPPPLHTCPLRSPSHRTGRPQIRLMPCRPPPPTRRPAPCVEAG